MVRRSRVSRPSLLRVLIASLLSVASIVVAFAAPGASVADGGGACTALTPMAAPFVGPDSSLGFNPTAPLDDNANVNDAAGTGQMFERVNSPGITDVANVNSTTGVPDNSATGTERKGMGGSVVADINSDGLTDIVLQYDKLGAGATQSAFVSAMTRFMLNDGCGHFTEASHSFSGTGVNAIPVAPNAAGNTAIPYFADFNGDGWPDIYITRNKSSNSFYINNGDTNGNGKVDDFAYTNYANSMGLSNFNAYNRQAQIADINGDGFLDIAVGADQIANRPNIGRSFNRMFVYKPPSGGVNSPADFVSGTYEDRSGPTSDPGVTTQVASSSGFSAQGYQRPINLNPTTGLIPGFGGARDAASANTSVSASAVFGVAPVDGNPAFSPAPNPVYNANNPGYCNKNVDKAGPRLVLRDLDGDRSPDLIQSYHADMNTRIPPTQVGQTQQSIIDSVCSPSNWNVGVYAWQNTIASTGKFTQRTEADGNGLVDTGRLKYVGGKGSPAGTTSGSTPAALTTGPLTSAAIAGRAGTTADSTGNKAPTGTWQADPTEGDAPSLAYMNTADVNNDGKLDVIGVGDSSTISHAQTAANNINGRFWTNDGGFQFHESTHDSGLDSLNWTYDQWATFFGNETFPRSARIVQGACESSDMQGPNPGTCYDTVTHKGAADTVGDITPATSWAEGKIYGADTTFDDFNNDGAIDFLLSDRREIDGAWGEIRDVLYMNDGNGHFTPQKTTVSGVDSASIAAEVGDLNNDGLPDILMNADPLNTYTVSSANPVGDILRGVDPPADRFKDKIYINQGLNGAAANNYAKILLVGGLDRNLIGSQIYLYKHSDGTLLGRRDVYPTDSYKSSHGLDVHFGLGSTKSVDALVKLPDGGNRTFTNIPINDLVKLNVTTAAMTTTFDSTAPTVTIGAPVEGASFLKNSSHAASYSCADTGGSRLSTCAGPVADGADVDTSTAGAKTFTVHAADGAGNVKDVTVNYSVYADTTDPSVQVDAPSEGDSFFKGTTQVAHFSCSDAGGSGLSSCVGTVADGDLVDTSTAGAKTFSVHATDGEGNVTDETVHYSVYADTTAPTAQIDAPLEGASFFKGTVVHAAFSCADSGGSGLASCVGDAADGAAIDTSSAGAKTFSVHATDGEGNVTDETVHYSVYADTTAPTVQIDAPAGGASFLKDSVQLADFSCSDSGGSGLSSCDGTVADGAAIDTSSGGSHMFTVDAADGEGNVSQTTVIYTVVVPPVPTLAIAPSIQNGLTEGTGLLGRKGLWTNAPTSYQVQWQRSDVAGTSFTDISGATGNTYRLVTADVGRRMRFQVIAVNAGGASSVASSPPSAVVITLPPINKRVPTITGSPVEKQIIRRTSLGLFSGKGPITYVQQWQRSDAAGTSWTNITGATGSAYKLTASDVGFRVRLMVTATNPGGPTATPSAATAEITH